LKIYLCEGCVSEFVIPTSVTCRLIVITHPLHASQWSSSNPIIQADLASWCSPLDQVSLDLVALNQSGSILQQGVTLFEALILSEVHLDLAQLVFDRLILKRYLPLSSANRSLILSGASFRHIFYENMIEGCLQ
jgi:hypothetical protein